MRFSAAGHYLQRLIGYSGDVLDEERTRAGRRRRLRLEDAAFRSRP